MKTNCVGKCSLHPIEKYCTGCNRTIHDITNWGKYTIEERIKILEKSKELVYTK